MVLSRGFSRCSRHLKRSHRSLTRVPSKASSFSSIASPLAPANSTVTMHTGLDEHPPTVSTYRRQRIPTDGISHRIPLSIVDMHLRHEQLPFCYFFEETLDEEALLASLQVVLRDFPQMGGSICNISHTAIQCQPDDTVHISLGRMNMSLEDWQSRPRGHMHQSACSAQTSENIIKNKSGGHPILLPLFDNLFEEDNDTTNSNDRQALVKIRVTYFQDKHGMTQGTAIAVNTCHALGDTATCVKFVESWGKQMRQKGYQKDHCTDRSKACVSGMMTSEVADVMGLFLPSVNARVGLATSIPKLLRTWLFQEDGIVTKATENTTKTSSLESAVASLSADSKELPPSTRISHQYVRLPFSVKLLDRLKDMGSSSCQGDTNPNSFVSTNDMLTSYGWLLKRHLSQQEDHNLSMVMNLRGRSGVNPNLFGNGISHVVASTSPHQETQGDRYDATSASLLFTDTLCFDAKAIREALELGLSDLPHALTASQMGRALTAPANSTQSFCTTSWGQFPLYQIRFAQHRLSGFHGHPAHPLPVGRTFASVITPCPDGGFWYEMLLPSDQAQEARDKHLEMTAMCMAWEQPTVIDASQSSSIRGVFEL